MKNNGVPARHLVLMVKVPVAGHAKTRLARGVGVARATGLYRAMTAATIARVVRPKRWQTYLAVTPDRGCCDRVWPANLKRFGQGAGDLGARMHRVMVRMPPGPVVIIGTDVPGITAMHIADAFGQIGCNDAVFGPSCDGGYWLTGLRRRTRLPRAYDNVRWSAPETLKDTLANLSGLRVVLTKPLDDVDELRDLIRIGSGVGRLIS